MEKDTGATKPKPTTTTKKEKKMTNAGPIVSISDHEASEIVKEKERPKVKSVTTIKLKQKGRHGKKSVVTDLDEYGRDDISKESQASSSRPSTQDARIHRRKSHHSNNVTVISSPPENPLPPLVPPIDPDAESSAAEAVQEFWDTAWTICAERFYHENAAKTFCILDLRDTWLRIMEMEWLDVDMLKTQQNNQLPRAMFMPDEPLLPLEPDTWTRGGLEEFPAEKRESILDPFLRDYSKIPDTIRKEFSWINGDLLLGPDVSETSTVELPIIAESKKSIHIENIEINDEPEGEIVETVNEIKDNEVKTEERKDIVSKSSAKQKLFNKPGEKKTVVEKPKKVKPEKFTNKPQKSKKKASLSQFKPRDNRKSKIPRPVNTTQKSLVDDTEVKALKLISLVEEQQLVVPTNSETSSMHEFDENEDDQLEAPSSTQFDNDTATTFPITPDLLSEEILVIKPEKSLSKSISSEQRLKSVFGPRRLESTSSVDIADYYNSMGMKPWKPEDCGVWTGKGHGIFRLPNQTTNKALRLAFHNASMGSKPGDGVEAGALDLTHLTDTHKHGEHVDMRLSRNPSQMNNSESRADFMRYKSLKSVSMGKIGQVHGLQKLTPSERHFFDHKMHVFRIKLLRQSQLKEHGEISTDDGAANEMKQVEVDVTSDVSTTNDISNQRSKSIIDTEKKAVPKRITIVDPITGRTTNRRQTQRGSTMRKSELQSITPNQDDDFLTRLAAKGVIVPALASNDNLPEIQRTKKMLMRHSLFTSKSKRQVALLYSQLNIDGEKSLQKLVPND